MNRAINVLLFSSDSFVACLYIAHVLSVVWLVHRDAAYVVYKGKVPGVYDNWEECRRQVHRFSGNSYKGYTTRAEAECRYVRYLAGEEGALEEPDED